VNTTKPWLNKKAWAENRIRSNSRAGLIVIWLFAIIWNALSAPILFAQDDLAGQIMDRPEVALALLFPLVGLGLFAAALVATRKWLRYGKTPLVLDPFPASLGGHAGGTLDVKLPYKPDQLFDVTLCCLYSYVSGSGKNRKRRNKVVWQTEGFCHTQSGPRGTRLSFRFDLPEDLPESEDDSQTRYHFWRVRIKAEVDGPDFDYSYIIPVFKTRQAANSLTMDSASHREIEAQAKAGIEEVAELQSIPGGVSVYFPAFQRPGAGFGTLLFGMIFFGAGVGLSFVQSAGLIFVLVFGGMGLLIFCFGVYLLAKSLEVRVTREGIASRRLLFGYPVYSRILKADQVQSLKIDHSMTSQSGNETTVHYDLKALGEGTKVLLGERLIKRAEAEKLKELYALHLGRHW